MTSKCTCSLYPRLLCCRTLYGGDGRFIVDNINEWQHSAMYAAFMLSGIVDLVAFYTPQGTLPAGTEQVNTFLLCPCTSTNQSVLCNECLEILSKV